MFDVRSHAASTLSALCAAIVLLLSTSADAQVVTLASLEARAVSDSPSLAARAARVRAAEARVSAIRAEMRPRLSAEMGVQLSPGAITAVPCDKNGDNDTMDEGETCFVRGQLALSGEDNDPLQYVPATVASVALRFEGVLYDFGRTAARVEAANAEVGALEADIEAAEDALVRMVRGGYLNWLGAHLRRTATEASLAVAEQRVRGLDAALAAGARSQADRDGAAIEVARMRLELSRARSAEAASRRVLSRIVGQMLADSAIPEVGLIEQDPPARSRPSDATRRALELRREVARLGERAYRLRFAPVLSFSAQAGIGAQITVDTADDTNTRPDVLGAPSYQLGVNLSIPLWDPRTRGFLRDEALAQVEILEASLLETQNALDSAELEARARIEETEAEIELAQAVVDATERAANGTEERFRVAGGNIDNVLNARERERRAREELMRTRLERTDAVLRLLPIR